MKTFLTLAVAVFFIATPAFAFIGPSAGQNPGSGSGAFLIDANGNVGFGTAAPTPTNGAYNNVIGIAATSSPGLGLKNISAGGRSYVLGSRVLAGLGQFTIFDDTANAVRFVIDNLGEVGIATTTPGQALDVNGNIRTNGSLIGNFSGAVGAANVTSDVFGRLQGNGNFAFPASLGIGTSSQNGLPQALSLYGNGYITGDVLIGASAGVTVPAANLHIRNVQAGAYANNVLVRIDDLYNAGANGQHLYLNGFGSGGFFTGLNFTNDWGQLTFGAGNAGVSMRHDLVINNGNVGVSTTVPAYKLEVIGDLRVSATSTFSGNFSFGGAAITNLNMNNKNITAVNKITVGTIDPLYTINGKKYATYVPSVSGPIREEYVGHAMCRAKESSQENNTSASCNFTIDFSSVEEGSPLWVWYKAVDFSKENVEVLATAYGVPAYLSYEIKGKKIIFHGNIPTEFSYRLSGRRFDWKDWPTFAKDQEGEGGLIIK